MKWDEICTAYPDQWLIIEALEAYTALDQQRHLERIAVVERCGDGSVVFERYRQLHQQHPEREYYFVHTSRENLDIHETLWSGVRRSHASRFEK